MEHFSVSDDALSQRSRTRSIFDRYFSFIEEKKPSDKFFFLLVLVVLVGALAYTLSLFNESNKSAIATSGGTLIEGVVGTPRFVNPVLAITRGDQDIVSLVYSGLMRVGSDGTLTPDIAESVTISDDGLVYNIVLRENVRFHDDTVLTANDVAFTVGLIQTPALKSPLRGNWNDVTVEVINDRELNFVLREPYTPFIENLTVGILPKHIWGPLSIEQLPFSQNNTEPIGSGPYKLASVDYNKSGLIDAYTLSAFDRGAETAKISNIVLRFYQNEEALRIAFDEGEIYSTAAFSNESLREVDAEAYDIDEYTLPRVFSVFFNQNKSAVLRDEAVREALSVAIDRELLVEAALDGYGVPTTSPIPPGFHAVQSLDATSTTVHASTTGNIRQAESILIDAGWEQQEDKSWIKEIDESPTKLTIDIATANTAVFEDTAEFLKTTWEALGVEVRIALFEQSDLVQAVIRPRDYQALLFGVDVGRALDLYPFWHSSQKDDPGLNVSLYTNITTDKLLETIRTTQDGEERAEALVTFEEEIAAETPAIFLYSPTFAYVVRNDIATEHVARIVSPSERFAGIHSWHMNESSVWPLFAD